MLVIIERRKDAASDVEFLYFQSNEISVVYQTKKISAILSQLLALLICIRWE